MDRSGNDGAGPGSAAGRRSLSRAPLITEENRARIVRGVHVSRPHRFVFFNNPKVACSTTKATLNREVARRAGQDLAYTDLEQIHLRAFNPLETPRQIGFRAFRAMLADPQIVKFAFVRDPVSRFLSAYLNKIHAANRTSPSRETLFDHLGRAHDRPMALREFARLCARDTAIRDLNVHWRLQRSQIAFDHVDFTVIGRFEAFADDFAAISRKIFGAEVEVYDVRKVFGNTTEAARLVHEIDAATLADIRAAYAEDFAMIAEIGARGMAPGTPR